MIANLLTDDNWKWWEIIPKIFEEKLRYYIIVTKELSLSVSKFNQKIKSSVYCNS